MDDDHEDSYPNNIVAFYMGNAIDKLRTYRNVDKELENAPQGEVVIEMKSADYEYLLSGEAPKDYIIRSDNHLDFKNTDKVTIYIRSKPKPENDENQSPESPGYKVKNSRNDSPRPPLRSTH